MNNNNNAQEHISITRNYNKTHQPHRNINHNTNDNNNNNNNRCNKTNKKKI